jgi:hypothetical protein
MRVSTAIRLHGSSKHNEYFATTFIPSDPFKLELGQNYCGKLSFYTKRIESTLISDHHEFRTGY